MALLPYHRATYITAEDISRARRRLEREAGYLQRFQRSILPTYYDLIYDTNPLIALAHGEDITQREPFLVLEFLEGLILQQVTRSLHLADHPPYSSLEWLAWQVGSAAASFSLALSQEELPHLYADFTASNIFLTWNPQQPVRLLDAGSFIPLHDDPAILPPFTWAYTSPDYYEAYDKGQRLWPTPPSVIYTLGKVLWQLLTGQQLVSGKDPDLSLPLLSQYSSALQEIMAKMLHNVYDDFGHLHTAMHPGFAPEGPHLVKLREFLNESDRTLQPKQHKTQASSFLPATRSASSGDRLRQKKTAHTDPIQALRYSPDGRFLAIACRQRIELWDAHSLQKTKVFNSAHQGIHYLCTFWKGGSKKGHPVVSNRSPKTP
jgi:hypothetical protein